jgi:hypothetical protein
MLAAGQDYPAQKHPDAYRPCLLPQTGSRPENVSSNGGECPGLSHRRGFTVFFGNMEATTSVATEGNKLVACLVTARCLIPELQANAMPLSAFAVGMEDLAAGGISAWKNPVRSCH